MVSEKCQLGSSANPEEAAQDSFTVNMCLVSIKFRNPYWTYTKAVIIYIRLFLDLAFFSLVYIS
jgi:hypothetical protein